MKILTFFLAGALFAVGLVVAGMTQPSKVIGFLDFAGNWDPSLAFVMMGAIGVHAVSYRLVKGRTSPLLAEKFQVPSRRDIDKKLVVGGMLFGAGWGLAGYCPGPALASAFTLEPRTLVFIASMATGMVGYSIINHFRTTAGSIQKGKAPANEVKLSPQPRPIIEADRASA